MTDLVSTAQAAIIAAFKGPLKPFLKEVTFDFLTSTGDYDAENDSVNEVYDSYGPFEVPVVRTTSEDLSQYSVEKTDSKIIVPGNWLPNAMEASDRVRIAGQIWVVRKTVDVPGNVVYILFVRRT